METDPKIYGDISCHLLNLLLKRGTHLTLLKLYYIYSHTTRHAARALPRSCTPICFSLFLPWLVREEGWARVYSYSKT